MRGCFKEWLIDLWSLFPHILSRAICMRLGARGFYADALIFDLL